MTSVALSILYAAEPLLMVVAMVALLRSREHRRFPALFAYVTVRLSSSVVLHLLMQMHRFVTVSEIEMGVPAWTPPPRTAYLATYGASRVCAKAAAEALGLA